MKTLHTFDCFKPKILSSKKVIVIVKSFSSMVKCPSTIFGRVLSCSSFLFTEKIQGIQMLHVWQFFYYFCTERVNKSVNSPTELDI